MWIFSLGYLLYLNEAVCRFRVQCVLCAGHKWVMAAFTVVNRRCSLIHTRTWYGVLYNTLMYAPRCRPVQFTINGSSISFQIILQVSSYFETCLELWTGVECERLVLEIIINYVTPDMSIVRVFNHTYVHRQGNKDNYAFRSPRNRAKILVSAWLGERHFVDMFKVW